MIANSDREALVREGDLVSPSTLRAWIREYSPRLLPVARAFAAGPEEAEDILQETWIAAWSRANSRSREAPIGPWLYCVLLNIGRSRTRRRKRREQLLQEWHESRARIVLGPRILEEEQARRAMWRAVAELPALQQRVVLMRVAEGFSTAETAEALERAEGTVKASLFRALRKLRRELGRGLKSDTMERQA